MVSCVVVDDDVDSLGVFSELLRVLGLDVLATGINGKDAVKLYDKYKPDLIFVDLIMPKYDGFYAIEHLRKINPDVKIVIITGDLRIGESYLLDSYSATAVIYKPIDPDVVKSVLANSFLD